MKTKNHVEKKIRTAFDDTIFGINDFICVNSTSPCVEEDKVQTIGHPKSREIFNY